MGYWHAVLVAQLAEALVARGAEVVVAVPDPGLVASFLPAHVPLVQAPFHVPPDYLLRGLQTRSFADILGAAGWREARVLGGLLRAWDTLIDLVKPAVLVADHAPTALLALAGAADNAATAGTARPIRTVRLGLGFTLPPTSGAAFPLLVETPAPPAMPSNGDEAQLLRAVQAVARSRHRTPPEALPAALRADLTLVTALRELDPYRALRPPDRSSVGPIEVLPAPSETPPDGAIAVYLAGDDPRTGPLLEALLGLGRPVRAHIREAAPTALGRWRDAGIALAESPSGWHDAVRAAALVVHHGGAGSCQVAAAAGRPQLLVPRHLEQALNTRALVDLGVARALPTGSSDDAEAATWRASALELLTPEARRAARRWATVIHGQLDEDAAAGVAREVLALIRAPV